MMSNVLSRLKAERDALNNRIALIEKAEQKAHYDACTQIQLLAINDERRREGKRQISKAEFASGLLMDEHEGA